MHDGMRKFMISKVGESGPGAAEVETASNEVGSLNVDKSADPWGHQACGIVVCALAPPVVLPWVV